MVIFSCWVQEPISTITLASTNTCSLQAVTMSTVREKGKGKEKQEIIVGKRRLHFREQGARERPSRALWRGRNDERLLKALQLQAPWRDVHLTTYDAVTYTIPRRWWVLKKVLQQYMLRVKYKVSVSRTPSSRCLEQHLVNKVRDDKHSKHNNGYKSFIVALHCTKPHSEN